VDFGLFSGLPREELSRLVAAARRRTFERNEVVFHRGDPGDSLHLIAKGRFAVRITTQLGETATLAVLTPGEVFGEIALLSGDTRRSATVVALEPAETYAVHATDVERLRHEHPGVNDVLIAILGERVRRVNERLVEALFLPADIRVLRRICDLALLYGHGGEASVIPLTQEDVAELAGTSRATVNRVLREEERRGTLALRRGRVEILAGEELRTRAGRGA
jgi:CRP-like cAMP-binding protein